MSKLEAVLVDLDGSLLDSRKRISEDDLQTIKTLREKGVRFHIVTGRPFPFTKQCAEDTGFDNPVSCNNGAYVYDFSEEKIVFHAGLIDTGDVVEIRDFCLENGIDYLLYALEDVIFDRPDSKRTLHWNKISDELFNDRNKLKFLYDRPDLDFSPYHFVKILLPYISDENADRIRERFGADGRYEICFSEKSVLDITPKGITKAFAVETLARLYGFDLKNTLVLGDNFNDESMLKVCGYPVVPENGEEEMKKLARYVTTDNDHSPLTHAVKALFPNLL